MTSARRNANGPLALACAAALAACAGRLAGDGDGGTCDTAPSLCVADASHDSSHDAGHDSAHFDAATFDAATFDSATFDSATFDVTSPDASIDASIDSAPDSAPDSSITGVLVFDSLTGTPGASTRGAGDSCGTHITVTTTQTIHGISVKNTLTTPTDIKFMIWNGGTLAYISAPKTFTTAGDSWKDSDPLTFTLVAGQSYDIGGISDTSGTWDYDTTPESLNGIASTIQNPNFTNYATPTHGSSGAADCGIRLYR